jgi:hypothetical protein
MDTEGVTRAAFTVTATDAEGAAALVASVTCNSKFQVPAALRVPVDMLGLLPAVHEKELPRLM